MVDPVAVERHAVRVTADALRQIGGGHPWVYDRSIRSGPDGATPGDLGVVFDAKRRFAAIGLLDPGSPLRLRILHHGAPRTIDRAFWEERVDAAIERRAPLLAAQRADPPVTNGWRVIHGENDGLPGLSADRYGPVLVVKIDTAALEPHLELIVDVVIERLARRCVPVETVVARAVRRLGTPPRVLRGQRPSGPVPFLENSLALEADVWEGQKTGHFLDQRDNRALIGSLAADADVLDVFSCSGGFSLNAASGGARSVISVDRSRWAMAAARRSFAANPDVAAGTSHETIRGDAFTVLAELAASGRRFDIVIIDPPSFASKAADRDGAIAAYQRLARLGASLTSPGGWLFQASCSSRVPTAVFGPAVAAGVAAAGRRWEVVSETGHPIDHPVGFPQGHYLDGVLGRIS